MPKTIQRDEELDFKPLEEIIEGAKAESLGLIPILQRAQEHYGYLPKPLLEAIADRLSLSYSHVFGVATFYAQFHLNRRGKYIVKQCDGTACHIKSSAVLIDQIYNTLGIRPGETTRDGLFSLETVNCIGACAIAPVMVINEKVYSKVSSSGVTDIIKVLRGDGSVKPKSS